jgi:hypothetical protein
MAILLNNAKIISRIQKSTAAANACLKQQLESEIAEVLLFIRAAGNH